MEIWSFEHPDLGVISVERGYDAEFREINPDWPEEPSEKEIRHVDSNAGFKERIEALVHNPAVRLQIKVNGEIRRQLTDVPSGRIALSKSIGDSLTTSVMAKVNRKKPHLYVHSNMFNEILSIEYREGNQVVEFTPPAGTRGHKRQQAMQESSIKRLLFPMMAGLGKSGWAIGVIILGPIVSRVVKKLLELLPEWDFIDLPELPSINLPVPRFPHITLPVVQFPDWELPHFELPWWVMFLLEYKKVWVPLMIAIFVGIVAVRNHKKSEEQKQQWESDQT
ncbi:hypothetical protein [Corynebacterium pseudotuberculosis]|uniref:Uncharacterized protein n=1 Tax=Corynebacterium pseudotuberculosis (strain C231) TaxID=681645 RepID=D9QDK2_CORP2|nr:hypothetical protein [Corynebacterium pseudotuberculosis]ADK27872.1 hypothetical protein CPFRC_00395 [Corynebacterium pseudotuberculosis FRC41]ADL09575.1 hypothetical protein CPC231_00395 [Corynebacterium pseudotuberculosis C231]ADL19985.1 hypothetical protein CP1002_00395 [Corynebacterium pseudotuberculosis 1002]ADO25373.1 hypothetical protein CPI19_00395 [Corynebacterium pseudotuberculosis I19]AEK91426.1 Hypothetical protein CpPAT10_0078 [Corynebacterium pseudotuberculosis PAT10]